jgi:hypothetical protein
MGKFRKKSHGKGDSVIGSLDRSNYLLPLPPAAILSNTTRDHLLNPLNPRTFFATLKAAGSLSDWEIQQEFC